MPSFFNSGFTCSKILAWGVGDAPTVKVVSAFALETPVNRKAAAATDVIKPKTVFFFIIHSPHNFIFYKLPF